MWLPIDEWASLLKGPSGLELFGKGFGRPTAIGNSHWYAHESTTKCT